MTLIVYERRDEGIGEIELSQIGGMGNLVDAYADIGKCAQYFNTASHSIDELFVNRNVLALRPRLEARLDKTVIRADGQDVAKIRGVPRGAIVTVSNGFEQTEHCADGAIIHIVAAEPARYQVSIECFPHLTRHFEIVAR